jgi:LmbE family N-acetylglucosaminyl deacetylase
MARLRMLACFAHPDDEAFPVGGALATYAARGVDIRLICATLGEEGEIRQQGSATRESLAEVRHEELRCSCRALGIQEPVVLEYRDSGMAGTPSNGHPRAFVRADGKAVRDRLVREMRRFRPQVVLSFGPDGLYGHPDHIAISDHTTAAFQRVLELDGGGSHPARLFYSVLPRGFRVGMARKLRAAGVDAPMPDVRRQNDGVPAEDIHVEMDTSAQVERKVRCLLCHRTQMSPDRPYHSLPRDVVADIIGREHFIRAYPHVAPGEAVPADLFEGISPEG